MKAFWTYTALRIALFLGCAVLIFAIWALVHRPVDLFGVVILAAVASALLSWRILQRSRQAFAANVEERAHRASTRFEEMRAKEDTEL